MTIEIPLPDQITAWGWVGIAALVWYPLIGLVAKKVGWDKNLTGSDPLPGMLAFVFSPFFAVFVGGITVAGFVCYVLSCGAVRPPWEWNW